MNLRRLTYIFSAFVCLLSLIACQFEDMDQCPDTNASVESYINLTIAVSSENQSHTRAPLGGENGDGREAGFERENQVKGITLILYQDNAGINTTSNPTLSFVQYFPTSKVSAVTEGTALSGDNNHDADKSDLDEAIYTTGDQRVSSVDLFGKSYHAIVIANKDLTGTLTTSSTLNDVKALIYGQDDLYLGQYGKAAYACQDFMMSSEYDFEFDLSEPVARETSSSTTKLFYRPENPIRIERLAARIDFWAAGATYQEKYNNNDIYGGRSGYVYPVEGSETDKFVVVSVTPFNLYTKGTTYGGEKLLKNLWRSEEQPSVYLLDETTTSYVLDPSTAAKTTANVEAFGTDGTYLNPLSQIYTDLNATTPKAMSEAGTPAYYQTVKSMHDKIGSQGGFGPSFNGNITGVTKTGENVIVAYPMENTLPQEATPTTPLYTYATGVVIEGDYYIGGKLDEAPKETRVYIGYLMHQNATETYTPFLSNNTALTTAVPSTTPMHYGVVRNNIYRISINKISKSSPDITLKIKVKKWDKFEHEIIYM